MCMKVRGSHISGTHFQPNERPASSFRLTIEPQAGQAPNTHLRRPFDHPRCRREQQPPRPSSTPTPLRGHGPRVVGHHPSTIRARRCVRTRPASAPSSPLARRARRSRAACPRVHALASLIAAPLGARTQAHEPWEPVQRSQRVRAARCCGPRSTRCADDPPYPRTSRESGAQQDASPDAALLTPSATG